MLGFLLRLFFVILVARMLTAAVRLIRGDRHRRRPPASPPAAGQRPRSAADILGEDVVDAEFEESKPEREP